MTQNRETGAAANQFGKDAAKIIAGHLGLKMLTKISNEVTYNGQQAVIKSAHLGNGYIGVSLKMLERIDIIIAAFENTDGHYDLYTLDVKTFKNNIRIGHHEHIGLVTKIIFLEEGKFIKTVKLEKGGL